MSKNTEQLLNENDNRHNNLFHYYDPIIGPGSPIDRKPLKLYSDRDIVLMIPVTMWEDCILLPDKWNNNKSFDSLFSNKKDLDQALSVIYHLRLKYDFEFWAATTVKIQDKLTKKLTPFVLNHPQLKLLKELEDMRIRNIPIRIIILKARQWGGSTLVQIYMSWIQLLHKRRWHSVIVADVEDQARNIRSMYNRLLNNYPNDLGNYHMAPFEGSSKNKIIQERGNIISIGSMQQPESLRSSDFSMSHLSEVGLWKDTMGKSPKDLVQSIRAAVPSEPYSLAVMESTAKGVGNFFHNEWLHAISGKGYRPVFIPWYFIKMYQKKVDDPKKQIESLTEYEQFLWDCGATLEGINWYSHFKRTENYDDWRMQSEFPTTDIEAFQSTGKRAFAPAYVSKTRKGIKEPIFVGEVHADEKKGEGAFKNIRFEKSNNGSLKIWKWPDDPKPDDGYKFINRYAAFADIGGRSQGSDYSALSLFDRFWQQEQYAGVPERVLTYEGHMDQDLFAWMCAMICKRYNDALLAVEINSLKYKEKQDTEGEHFYTVLDEIADHYENIFMRTTPEQIRSGIPRQYGFHTNVKSKGAMVDNYNAMLRDGGYIEYDKTILDQADIYESRADGTYGNVEGSGNHDDKLITTMGGLWLCTKYEYLDIPKQVKIKEKGKKKRGGLYKNTGSYADI